MAGPHVRRTFELLVAVAACTRDTPAPAKEPALPWVQSFRFDAATETSSKAVPDLLDEWRRADPDCVASSGGMEVVTPAYQVDVSYTQGVFVLDRKTHHLIASAPGFSCEGSADELEAIAVGDAGGPPLVLVAVTQGGHREATTWLYAFRIAEGTLEPVFAQPVEEHEGGATRTGSVAFAPGALVYRHPSGQLSQWTYENGRYVATPSPPAR